MFKRFIGFLAALMSLAVFVACGNNTELDEVDFMSIRDVELGLTFSLGMTADEVLDILHHAGVGVLDQRGLLRFSEEETTSMWLYSDSGIYFRLVDDIVVLIQAQSYIGNERFESSGYSIGRELVPGRVTMVLYDALGNRVPLETDIVYAALGDDANIQTDVQTILTFEEREGRAMLVVSKVGLYITTTRPPAR